MEELEKQTRFLVKFMIFFTTFIAIKDLFIFAWAAIVFYNTHKISALFLSLLSLGVSFLFINLRNKFVKEKEKHAKI